MLYKCKPARVEICDNTARKTAAQVKAATGCDIVFNGGLYDMGTFKACCDVRAGGRTLSNDPYTYWGYGWSAGELPRVMNSVEMGRVDNYISCLWAIHNGAKEALDNNHSGMGGVRGRTAFGFTAGGEMVVLCVADGSGALSLTGARDALYNAGCVNGIILDGGGSSQIICPAGTISSARVVSNLICVWLKDDEKEDKPMAKKICLDPGHGLKEPNQSPDGTYFEHEFTLDMGNRIRGHLVRNGLQVMLTREDSSTPTLSSRAQVANAWGADLFVSLHSNAVSGGWNDSASGFTVWTYAAGGERERAARLLLEEIKAAGVKTFGQELYHSRFTVLASTNMPAMLPEYAFHTCRGDVALLKSEAHRALLAEATAKAIVRWCGAVWVPEPVKEPEAEEDPAADENTIFRVQVGAFTKEDNAKAMAEKLGLAGYSTVIKKEGK